MTLWEQTEQLCYHDKAGSQRSSLSSVCRRLKQEDCCEFPGTQKTYQVEADQTEAAEGDCLKNRKMKMEIHDTIYLL